MVQMAQVPLQWREMMLRWQEVDRSLRRVLEMAPRADVAREIRRILRDVVEPVLRRQ